MLDKQKSVWKQNAEYSVHLVSNTKTQNVSMTVLIISFAMKCWLPFKVGYLRAVCLFTLATDFP